MGFFDKVLVTGGVVLAGVLAKSAYQDAKETQRRKNSPLRFDLGVTQSQFAEMVHDVARRTTRVENVAITGLVVTLFVRSSSGLSTWTAEVDFNDYGQLTGTYWVQSENSDSLIPAHFADEMRDRLTSRVATFAAGEPF